MNILVRDMVKAGAEPETPIPPPNPQPRHTKLAAKNRTGQKQSSRAGSTPPRPRVSRAWGQTHSLPAVVQVAAVTRVALHAQVARRAG